MANITAVAYARYSSDKQQESSITVQLAAIRNFCERHKVEMIHEYVDEAQTGTNANRMAFQEMVRDAKNKEFQYIIVHRMDRWARNVDDARYYKRYFRKYGIRIVSAIEEFDDTPEGEFFELMSMGMAEMYSKKLAREAKAGVMANAREGKAHGGTPPIGYTVKNKHYVIVEEEAKAVKVIFEMVAEGYGYRTIQKFLNANGYKRADGKEYSAHFYDILRNRQYTGEYVFNKGAYRARGEPYNSHKMRPENEIIRIPHAIPQIISYELFNKVQSILDSRKRPIKSGHYEKRRFLLTGLARCANCGYSICGNTSTNHGKVVSRYKCNNTKGQCNTKDITALYLDEYITSIILDCIFAPRNYDNLYDLIKVCYQKVTESIEEEKQSIKEEIKRIEKEIEETEKSYVEGARVMNNIITQTIEELKIQMKNRVNDYREIDEKLSRLPKINKLAILAEKRKIYDYIENDDFFTRQKGLSKIIYEIQVDDDYVKTILDFSELIGSYVPVYATIIERRDFIARTENHYRQSRTFSTLSVSLDQKIKILKA